MPPQLQGTSGSQIHQPQSESMLETSVDDQNTSNHSDPDSYEEDHDLIDTSTNHGDDNNHDEQEESEAIYDSQILHFVQPPDKSLEQLTLFDRVFSTIDRHGHVDQLQTTGFKSLFQILWQLGDRYENLGSITPHLISHTPSFLPNSTTSTPHSKNIFQNPPESVFLFDSQSQENPSHDLFTILSAMATQLFSPVHHTSSSPLSHNDPTRSLSSRHLPLFATTTLSTTTTLNLTHSMPIRSTLVQWSPQTNSQNSLHNPSIFASSTDGSPNNSNNTDGGVNGGDSNDGGDDGDDDGSGAPNGSNKPSKLKLKRKKSKKRDDFFTLPARDLVITGVNGPNVKALAFPTHLLQSTEGLIGTKAQLLAVKKYSTDSALIPVRAFGSEIFDLFKRWERLEVLCIQKRLQLQEQHQDDQHKNLLALLTAQKDLSSPEQPSAEQSPLESALSQKMTSDLLTIETELAQLKEYLHNVPIFPFFQQFSHNIPAEYTPALPQNVPSTSSSQTYPLLAFSPLLQPIIAHKNTSLSTLDPNNKPPIDLNLSHQATNLHRYPAPPPQIDPQNTLPTSPPHNELILQQIRTLFTRDQSLGSKTGDFSSTNSLLTALGDIVNPTLKTLLSDPFNMADFAKLTPFTHFGDHTTLPSQGSQFLPALSSPLGFTRPYSPSDDSSSVHRDQQDNQAQWRTLTNELLSHQNYKRWENHKLALEQQSEAEHHLPQQQKHLQEGGEDYHLHSQSNQQNLQLAMIQQHATGPHQQWLASLIQSSNTNHPPFHDQANGSQPLADQYGLERFPTDSTHLHQHYNSARMQHQNQLLDKRNQLIKKHSGLVEPALQQAPTIPTPHYPPNTFPLYSFEDLDYLSLATAEPFSLPAEFDPAKVDMVREQVAMLRRMHEATDDKASFEEQYTVLVGINPSNSEEVQVVSLPKDMGADDVNDILSEMGGFYIPNTLPTPFNSIFSSAIESPPINNNNNQVTFADPTSPSAQQSDPLHHFLGAETESDTDLAALLQLNRLYTDELNEFTDIQSSIQKLSESHNETLSAIENIDSVISSLHKPPHNDGLVGSREDDNTTNNTTDTESVTHAELLLRPSGINPLMDPTSGLNYFHNKLEQTPLPPSSPHNTPPLPRSQVANIPPTQQSSVLARNSLKSPLTLLPEAPVQPNSPFPNPSDLKLTSEQSLFMTNLERLIPLVLHHNDTSQVNPAIPFEHYFYYKTQRYHGTEMGSIRTFLLQLARNKPDWRQFVIQKAYSAYPIMFTQIYHNLQPHVLEGLVFDVSIDKLASELQASLVQFHQGDEYETTHQVLLDLYALYRHSISLETKRTTNGHSSNRNGGSLPRENGTSPSNPTSPQAHHTPVPHPLTPEIGYEIESSFTQLGSLIKQISTQQHHLRQIAQQSSQGSIDSPRDRDPPSNSQTEQDPIDTVDDPALDLVLEEYDHNYLMSVELIEENEALLGRLPKNSRHRKSIEALMPELYHVRDECLIAREVLLNTARERHGFEKAYQRTTPDHPLYQVEWNSDYTYDEDSPSAIQYHQSLITGQSTKSPLFDGDDATDVDESVGTTSKQRYLPQEHQSPDHITPDDQLDEPTSSLLTLLGRMDREDDDDHTEGEIQEDIRPFQHHNRQNLSGSISPTQYVSTSTLYEVDSPETETDNDDGNYYDEQDNYSDLEGPLTVTLREPFQPPTLGRVMMKPLSHFGGEIYHQIIATQLKSRQDIEELWQRQVTDDPNFVETIENMLQDLPPELLQQQSKMQLMVNGVNFDFTAKLDHHGRPRITLDTSSFSDEGDASELDTIDAQIKTVVEEAYHVPARFVFEVDYRDDEYYQSIDPSDFTSTPQSPVETAILHRGLTTSITEPFRNRAKALMVVGLEISKELLKADGEEDDLDNLDEVFSDFTTLGSRLSQSNRPEQHTIEFTVGDEDDDHIDQNLTFGGLLGLSQSKPQNPDGEESPVGFFRKTSRAFSSLMGPDSDDDTANEDDDNAITYVDENGDEWALEDQSQDVYVRDGMVDQRNPTAAKFGIDMLIEDDVDGDNDSFFDDDADHDGLNGNHDDGDIEEMAEDKNGFDSIEFSKSPKPLQNTSGSKSLKNTTNPSAIGLDYDFDQYLENERNNKLLLDEQNNNKKILKKWTRKYKPMRFTSLSRPDSNEDDDDDDLTGTPLDHLASTPLLSLGVGPHPTGGYHYQRDPAIDELFVATMGVFPFQDPYTTVLQSHSGATVEMLARSVGDQDIKWWTGDELEAVLPNFTSPHSPTRNTPISPTPSQSPFPTPDNTPPTPHAIDSNQHQPTISQSQSALFSLRLQLLKQLTASNAQKRSSIAPFDPTSRNPLSPEHIDILGKILESVVKKTSELFGIGAVNDVVFSQQHLYQQHYTKQLQKRSNTDLSIPSAPTQFHTPSYNHDGDSTRYALDDLGHLTPLNIDPSGFQSIHTRLQNYMTQTGTSNPLLMNTLLKDIVSGHPLQAKHESLYDDIPGIQGEMTRAQWKKLKILLSTTSTPGQYATTHATDGSLYFEYNEPAHYPSGSLAETLAFVGSTDDDQDRPSVSRTPSTSSRTYHFPNNFFAHNRLYYLTQNARASVSELNISQQELVNQPYPERMPTTTLIQICNDPTITTVQYSRDLPNPTTGLIETVQYMCTRDQFLAAQIDIELRDIFKKHELNQHLVDQAKFESFMLWCQVFKLWDLTKTSALPLEQILQPVQNTEYSPAKFDLNHQNQGFHAALLQSLTSSSPTTNITTDILLKHEGELMEFYQENYPTILTALQSQASMTLLQSTAAFKPYVSELATDPAFALSDKAKANETALLYDQPSTGLWGWLWSNDTPKISTSDTSSLTPHVSSISLGSSDSSQPLPASPLPLKLKPLSFFSPEITTSAQPTHGSPINDTTTRQSYLTLLNDVRSVGYERSYRQRWLQSLYRFVQNNSYVDLCNDLFVLQFTDPKVTRFASHNVQFVNAVLAQQKLQGYDEFIVPVLDPNWIVPSSGGLTADQLAQQRELEKTESQRLLQEEQQKEAVYQSIMSLRTPESSGRTTGYSEAMIQSLLRGAGLENWEEERERRRELKFVMNEEIEALLQDHPENDVIQSFASTLQPISILNSSSSAYSPEASPTFTKLPPLGTNPDTLLDSVEQTEVAMGGSASSDAPTLLADSYKSMYEYLTSLILEPTVDSSLSHSSLELDPSLQSRDFSLLDLDTNSSITIPRHGQPYHSNASPINPLVQHPYAYSQSHPNPLGSSSLEGGGDEITLGVDSSGAVTEDTVVSHVFRTQDYLPQPPEGYSWLAEPLSSPPHLYAVPAPYLKGHPLRYMVYFKVSNHIDALKLGYQLAAMKTALQTMYRTPSAQILMGQHSHNQKLIMQHQPVIYPAMASTINHTNPSISNLDPVAMVSSILISTTLLNLAMRPAIMRSVPIINLTTVRTGWLEAFLQDNLKLRPSGVQYNQMDSNHTFVSPTRTLLNHFTNIIDSKPTNTFNNGTNPFLGAMTQAQKAVNFHDVSTWGNHHAIEGGFDSITHRLLASRLFVTPYQFYPQLRQEIQSDQLSVLFDKYDQATARQIAINRAQSSTSTSSTRLPLYSPSQPPPTLTQLNEISRKFFNTDLLPTILPSSAQTHVTPNAHATQYLPRWNGIRFDLYETLLQKSNQSAYESLHPLEPMQPLSTNRLYYNLALMERIPSHLPLTSYSFGIFHPKPIAPAVSPANPVSYWRSGIKPSQVSSTTATLTAFSAMGSSAAVGNSNVSGPTGHPTNNQAIINGLVVDSHRGVNNKPFITSAPGNVPGIVPWGQQGMDYQLQPKNISSKPHSFSSSLPHSLSPGAKVVPLGLVTDHSHINSIPIHSQSQNLFTQLSQHPLFKNPNLSATPTAGVTLPSAPQFGTGRNLGFNGLSRSLRKLLRKHQKLTPSLKGSSNGINPLLPTEYSRLLYFDRPGTHTKHAQQYLKEVVTGIINPPNHVHVGQTTGLDGTLVSPITNLNQIVNAENSQLVPSSSVEKRSFFSRFRSRPPTHAQLSVDQTVFHYQAHRAKVLQSINQSDFYLPKEPLTKAPSHYIMNPPRQIERPFLQSLGYSQFLKLKAPLHSSVLSGWSLPSIGAPMFILTLPMVVQYFRTLHATQVGAIPLLQSPRFATHFFEELVEKGKKSILDDKQINLGKQHKTVLKDGTIEYQNDIGIDPFTITIDFIFFIWTLALPSIPTEKRSLDVLVRDIAILADNTDGWGSPNTEKFLDGQHPHGPGASPQATQQHTLTSYTLLNPSEEDDLVLPTLTPLPSHNNEVLSARHQQKTLLSYLKIFHSLQTIKSSLQPLLNKPDLRLFDQMTEHERASAFFGEPDEKTQPLVPNFSLHSIRSSNTLDLESTNTHSDSPQKAFGPSLLDDPLVAARRDWYWRNDPSNGSERSLIIGTPDGLTATLGGPEHNITTFPPTLDDQKRVNSPSSSYQSRIIGLPQGITNQSITQKTPTWNPILNKGYSPPITISQLQQVVDKMDKKTASYNPETPLPSASTPPHQPNISTSNPSATWTVPTQYTLPDTLLAVSVPWEPSSSSTIFTPMLIYWLASRFQRGNFGWSLQSQELLTSFASGLNDDKFMKSLLRQATFNYVETYARLINILDSMASVANHGALGNRASRNPPTGLSTDAFLHPKLNQLAVTSGVSQPSLGDFTQGFTDGLKRFERALPSAFEINSHITTMADKCSTPLYNSLFATKPDYLTHSALQPVDKKTGFPASHFKETKNGNATQAFLSHTPNNYQNHLLKLLSTSRIGDVTPLRTFLSNAAQLKQNQLAMKIIYLHTKALNGHHFTFEEMLLRALKDLHITFYSQQLNQFITKQSEYILSQAELGIIDQQQYNVLNKELYQAHKSSLRQLNDLIAHLDSPVGHQVYPSVKFPTPSQQLEMANAPATAIHGDPPTATTTVGESKMNIPGRPKPAPPMNPAAVSQDISVERARKRLGLDGPSPYQLMKSREMAAESITTFKNFSPSSTLPPLLKTKAQFTTTTTPHQFNEPPSFTPIEPSPVPHSIKVPFNPDPKTSPNQSLFLVNSTLSKTSLNPFKLSHYTQPNQLSQIFNPHHYPSILTAFESFTNDYATKLRSNFNLFSTQLGHYRYQNSAVHVLADLTNTPPATSFPALNDINRLEERTISTMRAALRLHSDPQLANVLSSINLSTQGTSDDPYPKPLLNKYVAGKNLYEMRLLPNFVPTLRNLLLLEFLLMAYTYVEQIDNIYQENLELLILRSNEKELEVLIHKEGVLGKVFYKSPEEINGEIERRLQIQLDLEAFQEMQNTGRQNEIDADDLYEERVEGLRAQITADITYDQAQFNLIDDFNRAQATHGLTLKQNLYLFSQTLAGTIISPIALCAILLLPLFRSLHTIAEWKLYQQVVNGQTGIDIPSTLAQRQFSAANFAKIATANNNGHNVAKNVFSSSPNTLGHRITQWRIGQKQRIVRLVQSLHPMQVPQALPHPPSYPVQIGSHTHNHLAIGTNVVEVQPHLIGTHSIAQPQFLRAVQEAGPQHPLFAHSNQLQLPTYGLHPTSYTLLNIKTRPLPYNLVLHHYDYVYYGHQPIRSQAYASWNMALDNDLLKKPFHPIATGPSQRALESASMTVTSELKPLGPQYHSPPTALRGGTHNHFLLDNINVDSRPISVQALLKQSAESNGVISNHSSSNSTQQPGVTRSIGSWFSRLGTSSLTFLFKHTSGYQYISKWFNQYVAADRPGSLQFTTLINKLVSKSKGLAPPDTPGLASPTPPSNHNSYKPYRYHILPQLHDTDVGYKQFHKAHNLHEPYQYPHPFIDDTNPRAPAGRKMSDFARLRSGGFFKRILNRFTTIISSPIQLIKSRFAPQHQPLLDHGPKLPSYEFHAYGGKAFPPLKQFLKTYSTHFGYTLATFFTLFAINYAFTGKWVAPPHRNRSTTTHHSNGVIVQPDGKLLLNPNSANPEQQQLNHTLKEVYQKTKLVHQTQEFPHHLDKIQQPLFPHQLIQHANGEFHNSPWSIFVDTYLTYKSNFMHRHLTQYAQQYTNPGANNNTLLNLQKRLELHSLYDVTGLVHNDSDFLEEEKLRENTLISLTNSPDDHKVVNESHHSVPLGRINHEKTSNTVYNHLLTKHFGKIHPVDVPQLSSTSFNDSKSENENNLAAPLFGFNKTDPESYIIPLSTTNMLFNPSKILQTTERIFQHHPHFDTEVPIYQSLSSPSATTATATTTDTPQTPTTKPSVKPVSGTFSYDLKKSTNEYLHALRPEALQGFHEYGRHYSPDEITSHFHPRLVPHPAPVDFFSIKQRVIANQQKRRSGGQDNLGTSTEPSPSPNRFDPLSVLQGTFIPEDSIHIAKPTNQNHTKYKDELNVDPPGPFADAIYQIMQHFNKGGKK